MMRIAFCLALCAAAFAEEYTHGPDSQRQPGVPQGKVTKHSWTSRIFPGTTRDYWVYVPAQYDGMKPACVMIFQDGGGMVGENSSWRAPVVLDNLIHKRDMPVTVGIFINPGVLPAISTDHQARYNRSFEYDALGDRYARFLLEELLPEVGKQYKLSTEPNDRGLAGSSSGGIAAFTAAWTRPDAFRRVLSFIGSYTNLRGGHSYSSLIRKTEPKPLRVYLQDGSADQNIYSGNWWIGNQDVASALEYAGYDTTFVTGTEGHNGKHGSAILPDALRWLWREYPKPVATAARVSPRHEVRMILDPAQGWEPVSGATIPRAEASPKQLAALKSMGAKHFALTANNTLYVADPASKRISIVDPEGGKRVAAEGVHSGGVVALSADQSLVYVSDADGRRVWSFQVEPDGSLANGQPFYRMENMDDDFWITGMTVDTEGYLYVATALGVQICDQAGRVVAIANPPTSEPIMEVAFGGADLKTLYVTAGGKTYRRPMQRKGVLASQPVKPPTPRL